MWLLFTLTLFIGATAELLDGIQNIDDKFEPQVAFLCGYPNVYFTKDGWQTDRMRGCLTKPQDIFDYCKKKYPNLTITNIVPASSEESLPFTTSFRGFSTMQRVVRPYRCIVGEFDSDALLVPDVCRFAHYDNDNNETGGYITPQRCASYNEWNITARERCEAVGEELYSFGVIVPCSVGMFRGAEYVCCPPNPSATTTVTEPTTSTAPPTTDNDFEADYIEEDSVEDGSVEPEETETETDDSQEWQGELVSEVEDDYAEFMYDEDICDAEKNYYKLYMETPEQIALTEHDAYGRAVRCTKSYYKDQKERLVNQQEILEERTNVLAMKNVTMTNEMRDREFQTLNELFLTTENTGKNVLLAMYNEHQRRIETRLEDRRMDDVEKWMNVLDEVAEYDDLEAVKPVMAALKQYIRGEEKLRVHWINRFEHLLDTNPEEAERIKLTVQEMLRQIHQRIVTVTNSLKRVPRIQSTLRSLLQEFLDSYSDVDQEVRFLFPELNLEDIARNMMPNVMPTASPVPVDYEVGEPDCKDLPTREEVEGYWLQDNNVVRVVSNQTLVIIVASVFAFAVISSVIICCLCRRRNRLALTGKSRRILHVKATNIYHVPTSAMESKTSPRILMEDELLRKKVYEYPIDGARLELSDAETASETASLVNNAAEQPMQSQQSLA